MNRASEHQRDAPTSDREADPELRGDAGRPRAGAVDDELGADRSGRRLDGHNVAGRNIHRGDIGAALDRDTHCLGGHGHAVEYAVLIQEPVAGTEARAGQADAPDARATCADVARAKDLALDAEITLQSHPAAELGERVGRPSEEQVADPAKGDVDAESIFELGPEGFAEDRQLNVGSRPPLGADAASVSERATG